MAKTKHRCCLDSQKCENIKSLADLTEHDSFVSFSSSNFYSTHPQSTLIVYLFDKRSKEKTKGFLSIL